MGAVRTDILSADLARDTPADMARNAAQLAAPKKGKEAYRGFNPIYLNMFQRRLYNYAGRVCGVRAGRGTGKTTSLGIHTVQCAQSIPRGTGLFVTPSLKSCYTKLQPALIKSMEQVFGLMEGIHFVRERPNPKWKWPNPLAKPRTYDNSLSFYTGHITYFTSIQSKASGNGLNLTDCTGDEFRYCDYRKFVEEIRPSIRGEMYDNPGWTSDNPFYKSLFLMSDAAVTPKQLLWETEFRKLITHKENERLADMLAEMEVAPELVKLPKFIKQLNRQKYKCANLFEFNTLYNVEVLGEDYIRDLQISMPPILFAVQIMSQPLDGGIGQDAYYYCLNTDIHLYDRNEEDETNAVMGKSAKVFSKKDGYGGTREWEAPDLNATASHAEDDFYDVDLDPKLPLCLSWDLNANFNTVVVSQRIPHKARTEIRFVNCLFTKYKEKLRALVAKFMAYYATRRTVNNELIVITDATMRQGASYALEDTNTRYISVIRDVLTRGGWEVREQDLGTPMLHEEKFQLINDVLSGQTSFDIAINKELDFLVLALTKARVIQTARGPQKDKSKEKLASERENTLGEALETRTDVTDAFDQGVIAAVKAQRGTAPRGTRGVFFSLPTTLH